MHFEFYKICVGAFTVGPFRIEYCGFIKHSVTVGAFRNRMKKFPFDAVRVGLV